jgi:hypothetical protein
MSLTGIGIALSALSGIGYLVASFTWRRKWARASALAFTGAITLVVIGAIWAAITAPEQVAQMVRP